MRNQKSAQPGPMTPDATPIQQVISDCDVLTRLAQRLQASQTRFAAIRRVVPAPLMPHMSAGPVDEAGWSLLVANTAVAAKLRQLQPMLEQQLQSEGLSPSVIRIKVKPT